MPTNLQTIVAVGLVVYTLSVFIAVKWAFIGSRVFAAGVTRNSCVLRWLGKMLTCTTCVGMWIALATTEVVFTTNWTDVEPWLVAVAVNGVSVFMHYVGGSESKPEPPPATVNTMTNTPSTPLDIPDL